MFDKAALIAVAVAASGLAAVLGTTQADAAPEPVTTAPAAPAMGWHLIQEGAQAKLAYGVAQSDHIALMMSCEAGADAVEVFAVVPGTAPDMALASGGRMTELAAAPSIDPLSGALAIATQVAADSAALERFKSTGELALVADDPRRLDARGAERQAVDAFFRHCEA